MRCGGGANHRLDLADAAMIEDNHLIARAGERHPEALQMRIRELRAALPAQAFRYVEVRSQAELKAALSEQLPAIQFDGFGIQALREAVKWVHDQPSPHALLEATGSVDPASLKVIAATGLTRISVDALTTQAPAIDMRMVLVP